MTSILSSIFLRLFAMPAVAARADYRCPRRGGEGAVRDAVEEILRREGKLAQAARAAFGAEL